MWIARIDLSNFKAYQNQTFHFPKPNDGKNLVLIGGMNGHGKTTLLEALYLCLYGEDATHHLARAGLKENAYAKFLQGALHGSAQIGRASSMRVSIRLMVLDDYGFDVTRTWYFGTNRETNAPARWLLNGRGYSPNVAIMGQAGSGKTRMMLKLLAQLREQTGAPVLLIDAGKDELADRPELARDLGAEVIKVPKAPIPLDMFAGSDAGLESARDVAMDFCASLDKALKDGLTDNQKPRVVEALKPLLAQRQRIPLADIQKTLEQHYEDNGIKEDRVLSSLRMMNQYSLFSPELTPVEFFGKSRILAFGGAPDESRRLALFLLFDALHRYLQTLPEAPMDAKFHRAVRLAFAIDEAKPLLAAKHDGLSKLVRLHRSHGLAVFMASQSPDDYEGQSDDYMEQIGLPICFKTNATSTAVLNNMFKARKGLNFSALEPGVCLTVLDGAANRVIAF